MSLLSLMSLASSHDHPRPHPLRPTPRCLCGRGIAPRRDLLPVLARPRRAVPGLRGLPDRHSGQGGAPRLGVVGGRGVLASGVSLDSPVPRTGDPAAAAGGEIRGINEEGLLRLARDWDAPAAPAFPPGARRRRAAARPRPQPLRPRLALPSPRHRPYPSGQEHPRRLAARTRAAPRRSPGGRRRWRSWLPRSTSASSSRSAPGPWRRRRRPRAVPPLGGGGAPGSSRRPGLIWMFRVIAVLTPACARARPPDPLPAWPVFLLLSRSTSGSATGPEGEDLAAASTAWRRARGTSCSMPRPWR